MEIRKNTVVVLTQDGQFSRLPRCGQVQIGEEYAYGASSSRPWLAVAAVLLLALASVFLPLTNPPVPAAYVTVDINPSLELTVSTSGKVMAVQALNADGEHFLQGLSLKKLPLDAALRKIFLNAEKLHYLDGESLVLITSTSINEGAPDVSETIVMAAANYLPSSASPVAVTVVTGTRELREEAQQLGLSIGKYAVYLEAQHEGLPLEVSALKEKGIGRALLDLDAHPGEFLQRVDREKVKMLAERALKRNIATNNKGTQEAGDDEGELDKQDEEPVDKDEPYGKGIKPTIKPVKQDKPVGEQQRPAQSDNQTVSVAIYEKIDVSDEPIILPAENEPILEEAKRSIFWDWSRFKDVIFPE
jgi:hypothetical protein